jgi:hypothetical protein
MAIKADRQVESTEIGYYINETASKGVIASVSTAGSGVSLDNSANLVTIAANSSGNKPVGLLLNEVVNVDLTRFPVNWHKDQVNVGSKVTLMTKGWVVTDKITGTPNAQDHAILSSSGTVAAVAPGAAWNEAANPKVGRFRSKKDQNGFARLYVDL